MNFDSAGPFEKSAVKACSGAILVGKAADFNMTPASLPTCGRCRGSSDVIVSELVNARIDGTVTMYRCRWCGYVTWDERPGPRNQQRHEDVPSS